VLTGGDGADVFVFLDKANDMGVANFDSIVGFESGSDSIELARSLLGTAYSATTSAGQAKFATGSWFKDTAAAIDADDRVIYDSKTGAVYFDADGSGSGARIQLAVLDGHPALVAADIHFV
jgi:Ca2+-binding RTX toxin-like protein